MEDPHSTQVSSTWEGTYFGVLPCDGCPGINRMITLYGDRSFKEVTEVLNSGDKPIIKVGKALWSKDGKSVVCAGSPYKVTENTFFIEYIDNKKGNFVLSKIDLSFDTNNKIGYVFEQFKGDDDKHYKLLFNTNTRIPTVYLQAGGMNRILSQTQGWAKGAEYSGSNVQLLIKKKGLELTLDNTKISLTPIN